MSKQKHKHSPHRAQSGRAEEFSPEPLQQRGLNAFNAGRFGEAITLWERAAKHHPEVIPALAEAYFRRAVSPTSSPEQQLHDLQRATVLVTNDACYYYHLGLAHHRRGELDTALTAYQIAAAANPQQRGLAFSFALAKLEADPNADASALTGLSEQERELIDTLASLLRGDTSFLNRAAGSGAWFKTLLSKLRGENTANALLRGLGHLLAGDDAAAQQALNSASRPLQDVPLSAHGAALRHYYLGVIAARRSDWSTALGEWQQARARGLNTPWLCANLAAVYLPNALTAVQVENWKAAVEQARAALQISPANPDLTQVAVVALGQLGQVAARAGDWKQAAAHWSEAHKLDTDAGKTDGTSRPPYRAFHILQNLAIASEMSEAWEQAAEAWRALLRAKPRSKKAQGTFTDAHWKWMRQRATQDLKKAGRLGEAITLLKQKVKSTPDDLVARMELAEALLANQQETAARNELLRILQRDPQQREARLKLAESHAARGEWYAAQTQMQQLLAQDPADETARKQMTQLMVKRGRALHGDGQVAAARAVFEQALNYAPHNADLYIDLGRAALDLRQPDTARQNFEQAYRWGAKQLSTHAQIVRCWTIARDLDEVKQALARAERETELNPLFYVHAGLDCLQIGKSPSPYRTFRTLGPPAAGALNPSLQPRGGTRSEIPVGDVPDGSPLEALGKTLLERAVTLKPDDPELLQHIAMDCLEARLPLGLPYGERLVKLTPNDADVWLLLAYLQLFAGQQQESQKSLQQTARLARQQGKHELERMANQMRRELGNPLLSLALGAGMPLDALFDQFGAVEHPVGEDEFEDEDEDEDEELFRPTGTFSLPRSRRRRK